ncbi:hypothetical protein [Geosporobacter ferrireducens]|uniref:hypothetical protein n=1 Tax=Geosporobacter ferrireducens TaxID=1424294 RepID=UPI0012EACCDC|nr:hypothetical protein [Geosporobacter ferrireducens]
MRKVRIMRRVLGIVLALIGSIIIIEMIPLWAWYSVLGALCLLFFLFLIKAL